MLQQIKRLFCIGQQKRKQYPSVLKSAVYTVSVQEDADKLQRELYGHLVVSGSDLIIPCRKIYGDVHVMGNCMFLDLEVVGGKVFVFRYGLGYMPGLPELVGGYYLMGYDHKLPEQIKNVFTVTTI